MQAGPECYNRFSGAACVNQVRSRLLAPGSRPHLD
jgi:hypothetical protein